MASKYIRALILSISIILVFLWTSVPTLNQYNLQLTGALVILYFGSRLIFRRSNSFFFSTLVFVSIALLLIFSTGGINSPIFFVLDFLLFAIALLISPNSAAVASAVLVFILIYQNYTKISSSAIIDILSLILITPLAIIFSKTYLKNLASEGKITILKEAIKDEQTESLLWIATSAKPSLASVLNSISDIVIYLNSKGESLNLPKGLIDKIKTVQKDLISLYSSTNTLETSIKESTDKVEL